MGKVDQIRAATKTVEVGGEQFEIHPLTNDELLSFDEPDTEEEMKDYLLGLLTTVLQKDDSSNTREKIEDAPSTLLHPIMEAVEEVNNLDFLDEETMEEAKKDLGLNK